MENLNEKEQLVLKNLVNPDSPKDQHYEWSLEMQQRMLGCLLADKTFLDQCLHLVKPIYFTDKAHQKICRIFFDYYHKYRTLPDKNLLEAELEEQFDGNPVLNYYLAELDVVCDSVKEGIYHREYFLDKMADFARTQAVRIAFAKTIDILSSNRENKWQSIENTMKEALSIQPNVDLGLNYFEDLNVRYDRMLKQKEDQDFFTSGFPSLDVALNGGLSRKEMGSFCGLSGGGKSLCLAGAAADNLSKGRKVLYISLEMDEDKTSCRFDSMLSMVPMQLLLQDHNEVIQRLKEYKGTLDNKADMWVKQFPAGSADILTIRSYLSQLSLQKGFTPDLIIVDYVGEMKEYPDMKTYESRQKLVQSLRALAMELNICVLTGMQISRGGREAMKTGYIDDSFLADSQGQIRPLDALWSINQEDAEVECGVGRIFVVKHRNGKSRFVIYFKRDSQTLKMTEISVETYKKIMSEYKQKNSLNVDIKTEEWKPNKPYEGAE